MGIRHLDRLRRARELLAGRGFDVSDTVLACYGGDVFDDGLRAEADRGGVHLVGVDDLYRPT